MDMVRTLKDMDEDALVGLLRARPDLLSPWPPRTLAELAARAQSWASLERAVEDLDVLGRAVTEGLSLLPAGAGTAASLATLMGPDVTADHVARAVDRLGALALVHLAGDRVELASGLRERTRYPARLGRPVASLLGHQSVKYLSQIASNLGLPPHETKGPLLDALAQALSESGTVATVVGALDPGAAQLVSQLAHAGPTAYAPPGLQWRGERHPISLPALLMSRGILAPLDWERVEMPREVALAMRGGLPFPDLTPEAPPVTTRREPAEETQAGAARAATTILGQVAGLLEEWEARPPRWLKGGGVGVRDVRRTAKALDMAEKDAYLIVEMAGASGLVGPDHASGDVLLTAAADRWKEMDPAGRWLALATGWCDCPRDLGVAGTANPAGAKAWAALAPLSSPGTKERRSDLLGALTRLPEGEAASPEGLAAHLCWMAPGRWGAGGRASEDVVGQLLHQAGVLGLTAGGALGRPGRLALTGNRHDAQAAARDMLPAPVSQITFQADLTAIAAGELAPGVAGQMALMADLESRGGASVWRLTESSIRRALDSGRSAEELAGFLDDHAARGVPQPLAYLVADVGRRHGRLRAGPAGAYVRSDDPALLAEVVQARRAAKLGLRLLAPTVAVTPASMPTVLDTLRAAGFLPAAESRDGTAVVTRAPLRRAQAHVPGDRRAPAGPDVVAIARSLRPAWGAKRPGQQPGRPRARQEVPA